MGEGYPGMVSLGSGWGPLPRAPGSQGRQVRGAEVGWRTSGTTWDAREENQEWRGESFRSGPSMFMNPEDVSHAGKVTHRQGSSSLHGGWAGAGGTPREHEPGLRWAGAQSRDIGSWWGMGWRTERTRRSSNCTTGAPAPDRPSVCSWTQCPWGRDMCEVAPREGHSQCRGWKVQCLWTGAQNSDVDAGPGWRAARIGVTWVQPACQSHQRHRNAWPTVCLRGPEPVQGAREGARPRAAHWLAGLWVRCTRRHQRHLRGAV